MGYLLLEDGWLLFGNFVAAGGVVFGGVRDSAGFFGLLFKHFIYLNYKVGGGCEIGMLLSGLWWIVGFR